MSLTTNDRGPTSTPSIASAEPMASGGFGFSLVRIVLQMTIPSDGSWFSIYVCFEMQYKHSNSANAFGGATKRRKRRTSKRLCIGGDLHNNILCISCFFMESLNMCVAALDICGGVGSHLPIALRFARINPNVGATVGYS